MAQAPPAQTQSKDSGQKQNQASEGALVRLAGSAHPFARPENDRGAVDDAFPAQRMVVLLNPPAERQQALQQFLRDVHAQGSGAYHQWVTPEQFGAQFGAREQDVQAVQAWLQAHGFSVNRLTKSRRALEFSGTAGQVREALHAPIHRYEVEGKTYYSVANDVAVPQTIAPLLKGFAPLNNFPLRSHAQTTGKAGYAPVTGRAKPEFTTTIPGGAPFYAVAPEDFATQYDIAPLYQSGTNGTGQTIGIIGEYNLDLTITAAYRALFGLSSDNTQVIIDGEDAGVTGTAGIEEGVGLLTSIGTTFVGVEPPAADNYLSVELAGAVAPKATVNYYLAGGSDFQDPVELAALRAVEDNQASVLSVAYHECEELLGPSGNQFWSSLWEQAAAQGQTVLVSSGDEGPAACGAEISVNGQITYLGPSVSGLASTPWNVAVGASDFYYSDYAMGAPSAASDWNASNDANFGSLKAPLPEQPWDGELGLNVPEFVGSAAAAAFINVFAFGESTGGGRSSCSQSTPSAGTGGLPYTCVSGYSKPSWQNAPGVPADGARDIPDISVLAADGGNLSAYAICVEVNDCLPGNSGLPQVTLAGGPAGSTAAMAGIMALVNQKYGRQGQANFVLYALAQQQPSIFHDITVGTNDVVCSMSAPNCMTAVPNTNVEYSFGIYNAGVGYDLASGLGSLDVNALIANWNKVAFSPTNTTLQLSPASIEHGAAVTVTASVKAASGTATPTGDVSLETTSATPILKSNVLTLASGTATSSLNFFPGGTYQVTAQYAGDGTFASSTSAASTLTVTPEPSTTTLSLECDCVGRTIANGGSLPLSSRVTFAAQPTGQTSQSTGDATGSATFTDGGTSITVPLNAQGIAYWSPQSLALGAHSVSVSYSGDASYGASNGGPFAFTVTKGDVQNFFPVLEGSNAISISQGPPIILTYLAGSTAMVRVSLSALNGSVPPTGNVTFMLGSMSQTAPVTAAILSNQTMATANASFPNVPAGTYTLSASYTGDSSWNAASMTATDMYTFASSTTVAIPTTTVISLTPTNADSSGVVTFSATVTASQAQIGPPIGTVTLAGNGYPFASIEVQTSVPSSVTATGNVSVPATAVPAGSIQVTGVFQGGTTYILGGTFQSSTSAPVALTITRTDFTLSVGAPSVIVKSGQSAAVPLLLGGPNGGSPTVSLSCLPSMPNFGCSISPSSPTLNGATTAMLTVNAFLPATGSTASVLATGDLLRSVSVACGGLLFVAATVLILRMTKYRRTAWACVTCCACITLLAGCGGGSSTMSPPPPQQVNAPPGNYAITVTATSGKITHNVKIAVIVQ